MGRVFPAAAAAAAFLWAWAGAAADPAFAQGKLPQYVAGPLSGYAYDCKQSKQAFDARAFVSTVDLDGDGKPDYIFDIARGCEANRMLYCNEAQGCNVIVYLSSQELEYGGEKARAFRIGTSGGRPALLLELGRHSACKGAASCTRAMIWDGKALVLVE